MERWHKLSWPTKNRVTSGKSLSHARENGTLSLRYLRPESFINMSSADPQQQLNGVHNDYGSTEAASSTPHDEHARLWNSAEHGADGFESLPRRAWHALLSPFSATALARLPRVKRPEKYFRADAIPQTETNEAGDRPTVRDYHSINLPPNVRIPKKIASSVKVEGKIWFANERSESTFGIFTSDRFRLLKFEKIGCHG